MGAGITGVDDDTAYYADQLWYAVDGIMANSNIVVFLSMDKIMSIRRREYLLGMNLKNYRDAGGFNIRRTASQSGAANSYVNTAATRSAASAAIPAVLPALLGAPAAPMVQITVSEIVEPLALAFFFSQLTDASGQDLSLSVYGDILSSSVTDLTRDLSDLKDLSSMAMDADQAAKTSDRALIETLANAIGATNVTLVAIITAELARRFPECLPRINEVKDAIKAVNVAKTNPGLFGAGWQAAFKRRIEALKKAFASLQSCIALALQNKK